MRIFGTGTMPNCYASTIAGPMPISSIRLLKNSVQRASLRLNHSLAEEK